MKNKIFSIFILWTVLTFPTLSAQTKEASSVIRAIEQADTEYLASVMNAQVDLSIPGTIESVVSKQQAKSILADFFSTYRPQKLTVVHSGQKDNSQFMICDMQSQGKSWRVTFLIKNNLIQQLRFE